MRIALFWHLALGLTEITVLVVTHMFLQASGVLTKPGYKSMTAFFCAATHGLWAGLIASCRAGKEIEISTELICRICGKIQ
jgi:hypothetical protein